MDKKLSNKFWSPLDIANINDWVLLAAAVKGKFRWHQHNDDEFFLIYKGKIVIDTENGPIQLKKGEGAVISNLRFGGEKSRSFYASERQTFLRWISPSPPAGGAFEMTGGILEEEF